MQTEHTKKIVIKKSFTSFHFCHNYKRICALDQLKCLYFLQKKRKSSFYIFSLWKYLSWNLCHFITVFYSATKKISFCHCYHHYHWLCSPIHLPNIVNQVCCLFMSCSLFIDNWRVSFNKSDLESLLTTTTKKYIILLHTFFMHSCILHVPSS